MYLLIWEVQGRSRKLSIALTKENVISLSIALFFLGGWGSTSDRYNTERVPSYFKNIYHVKELAPLFSPTEMPLSKYENPHRSHISSPPHSLTSDHSLVQSSN